MIIAEWGEKQWDLHPRQAMGDCAQAVFISTSPRLSSFVVPLSLSASSLLFKTDIKFTASSGRHLACSIKPVSHDSKQLEVVRWVLSPVFRKFFPFFPPTCPDHHLFVPPRVVDVFVSPCEQQSPASDGLLDSLSVKLLKAFNMNDFMIRALLVLPEYVHGLHIFTGTARPRHTRILCRLVLPMPTCYHGTLLTLPGPSNTRTEGWGRPSHPPSLE